MVTAVSAQASAYVPIMDPAYRELDALAAIGLVEVPSLVQRPYSRLVFGRLHLFLFKNCDRELSEFDKKYAKIVAIIGSPRGNAETIVGDTYLIA